MIRPQPYYFEDMVFQLEMNLQTIRRDLIRLLDEHRFNDCFLCNRLKCTCDTTSINSSYEDIMDAFYGFYKSPPPQDLPTPEWSTKTSQDSTNTWVKALPKKSKVQTKNQKFPLSVSIEDVNITWPPFPKSVWSHDREAEVSDIMECDKDNTITVDAFFRYFKSLAKTAKCSY